MKQIQITPVSAVDPSPTRGALAAEGAQLGTDVQLSEVMATETQSDEVSFWIIKVVGLAQEVPPDYVCPLTSSKDIDVIFEFPRAEKATMAVRFRPVVSRRGDSSVRKLEEDPSIQPFLVPCHLLRAGKLKLKAVSIVPPPHKRAPGRSCRRQSGAGGAPPVSCELSAADKAQVLERRRVFVE